MTRSRFAWLALALPILALTRSPAGSPRSPFPLGTYDSDAYTLTFETGGTFRYVKGDRLMVQGRYTVQDTTISITDETGPDACVGADRNPGTYYWRVVRRAVWFRLVQDRCPDRIRGLADQAWKPAAAGKEAATKPHD